MAADTHPIVRIQALRKSFGSNEVLKGIDLQVQSRRGHRHHRQERLGQEHAAALHQRSGGASSKATLEVDGQPLKQGDAKAMRALRQHVGMIFQSFNLFPHLSVGRNVMLAPTLVKKTAAAPRPRRARASCWSASAWPRSSTPGPTSCPAASSSAWPSPARWPCSPA